MLKSLGVFWVFPVKSQQFKTKDDGYTYDVRRTQLPLVPASTRIVYGAQGDNYDTVIVDLAPPPMMSPVIFWLAMYVMLTRARSLDGLMILRLPPREALSVGPPSFVIEEMNRLQQLHQSTVKKLKIDLELLLGDLPEDVAALWTQENLDDDNPDWFKLEADLEKEVQRRLADKEMWKCNSDADTKCLIPRKRLHEKVNPFSAREESNKRLRMCEDDMKRASQIPSAATDPVGDHSKKRRLEKSDAEKIPKIPLQTASIPEKRSAHTRTNEK